MNGPDHYDEAQDWLESARHRDISLQADDIAGAIDVLSMRVAALAHAQLAAVAAAIDLHASSGPCDHAIVGPWLRTLDPNHPALGEPIKHPAEA